MCSGAFANTKPPSPCPTHTRVVSNSTTNPPPSGTCPSTQQLNRVPWMLRPIPPHHLHTAANDPSRARPSLLPVPSPKLFPLAVAIAVRAPFFSPSFVQQGLEDGQVLSGGDAARPGRDRQGGRKATRPRVRDRRRRRRSGGGGTPTPASAAAAATVVVVRKVPRRGKFRTTAFCGGAPATAGTAMVLLAAVAVAWAGPESGNARAVAAATATAP
ncbi:unnamed protein product, partial [Ectocarpus sp. 12 AP-2014]